MALETQTIHLADIAQMGFSMASLMHLAEANRSGTPEPGVTGECYAFYSDRLLAAAEQKDFPWHLWLLQMTIAGLWEEHCKQKIFACYTVHTNVHRLFLCSKKKGWFTKFHKVISNTPPYMESGRDPVPAQHLRPLVYWEPPCTMVALWPLGLDEQEDGPRVVDTGNLVAYFSYPESDHKGGIPVDAAGPDYVRVPQEEHGVFELRGRQYRYLNRWAVIL